MPGRAHDWLKNVQRVGESAESPVGFGPGALARGLPFSFLLPLCSSAQTPVLQKTDDSAFSRHNSQNRVPISIARWPELAIRNAGSVIAETDFVY